MLIWDGRFSPANVHKMHKPDSYCNKLKLSFYYDHKIVGNFGNEFPTELEDLLSIVGRWPNILKLMLFGIAVFTIYPLTDNGA